MTDNERLLKIEIPTGDACGISAETPWASRTETRNHVRICNVPVITDKCTLDDIVEVDDQDKENGFPKFVRTVEHVRYPVPFTYDTTGLTDSMISERKKAFVKECERYDIKMSWPMKGIGIACIPVKNYEELSDNLEFIGEAANMDIIDIEFYVEDEEDNQQQYLDNLEKKMNEAVNGN